MRFRKSLRVALAGLGLAVAIPAVAVAAHPFTDVDPGAFYADAVDWAYNNGITTGTSPTTFEPNREVTRGENVTFAKRYDDNIVQPALADLESAMPTLHWAYVLTSGTVGRGSSGVTAAKNGTGSYTVDFGGVDITDCSWSVVSRLGTGLVVIGNSDVMISLQQGSIFPAGAAIVDQINVGVFDETGSTQDGPFNLQVIC